MYHRKKLSILFWFFLFWNSIIIDRFVPLYRFSLPFLSEFPRPILVNQCLLRYTHTISMNAEQRYAICWWIDTVSMSCNFPCGNSSNRWTGGPIFIYPIFPLSTYQTVIDFARFRLIRINSNDLAISLLSTQILTDICTVNSNRYS